MHGRTIEDDGVELSDQTIQSVLREARSVDPHDDRVTNQGDAGHVTPGGEFTHTTCWHPVLFNGTVTHARIDESPDNAPDDPEIHVTVEQTMQWSPTDDDEGRPQVACVLGKVTVRFTIVADPETHELRRAYASRVLVPETQRALA